MVAAVGVGSASASAEQLIAKPQLEEIFCTLDTASIPKNHLPGPHAEQKILKTHKNAMKPVGAI
jgi:hypothetical protein